MAEEKVELRDVNFRQLLPWTELFRGFQVALDPKKLLLAAAGILVMSFGWWVLAYVFYTPRSEPKESDFPSSAYQQGNESEVEAQAKARAAYEREHAKWIMLDEAARPGGSLNAWPWLEERGPNPYLLVTGRAGQRWELGQFGTWFPEQLPVLIEPLVKFLKPVTFLLRPNAGFLNVLYFLLALLWTLATWAVFGGAITRMAAVQLARKERISTREALRFALQRYVSFFSAPLFPLLFVVAILVLLMIYGVLHLIPGFGDIVVDGLGWPLVLLAGVVMAVILVGLIGWPMMYATISAEGSDSFDALSRSYSYVYQCPWHYLWNSFVAIAYGIAVVFFVGFMGSLMVYLGKWGVSQTPFIEAANREPSYLFIYAPESYGWRSLLLQGSPALDSDGNLNPEYVATLRGWNIIGAGMVAFWLHLAFLMVVGFGYSYFWCASTIIYLLMRRQVDDTELDEVYLEEDESDDAYSALTAPAAPSPQPAPGPIMVEAPTLKAPTPPAPPPAKAESAAPKTSTPPAS